MMHMFQEQISQSLGQDMTSAITAKEEEPAGLESWFEVSNLAVASLSAAAIEFAELLGATDVVINRRHALMWFGMTLRPVGWQLPSAWDSIAGDYQTEDGWIRLHTNAPHHRESALAVLGCDASKKAVAGSVKNWSKSDLEAAIVRENGCAAAMHSLDEWAIHPQGQAVATEPLILWQETGAATGSAALDGLRVLDLTRVLAGPVATRFLAGFGADVLRIDPPNWSEPGVEPEVTLGKRCAGLDLNSAHDRKTFEELISQADVLVHGYRPGALEGLGYDRRRIQKLSPGLIDVSLSAYGWSGPWADRRGFDSLVQMSCGIAAEGMLRSGAARPIPLPVQALDHATGYLMAAAIGRSLRIRQKTGRILSARLSLARTATLLTSNGVNYHKSEMAPETEADFGTSIENTGWGPARRIAFPINIAGRPAKWAYPAGPLRQANPDW